MAKQISHKNGLLLLKSAELLLLDFQKLKAFVYKHGINATKRNLTLALEKEPKKKRKEFFTSINFISFPKKLYKRLVIEKTKEGEGDYADLVDNFKDELRTVGFKLVEWKEDFVDEETGEVVSIPRCRFKYLNEKK